MLGIQLSYVLLCSQSCSGAVHLEVARFKAGLQYTQRSQVNCPPIYVQPMTACQRKWQGVRNYFLLSKKNVKLSEMLF